MGREVRRTRPHVSGLETEEGARAKELRSLWGQKRQERALPWSLRKEAMLPTPRGSVAGPSGLLVPGLFWLQQETQGH